MRPSTVAFVWLMLCVQIQAGGKFTLTVLEIPDIKRGAGLAIVMQTPSGKTFLYDTGSAYPARLSSDGWEGNFNAGRDVVLPFLKKQNIDSLDEVFISHAHYDHFGGLLWLAEHFPVKHLTDSAYYFAGTADGNFTGELGEYNKLRESFKKSGAYLGAHAGDILNVDPELKIEVIAPPKTFFGDPLAKTRAANDSPAHYLVNANSLGIRIQHGDVVFYLPGDIQTEDINHSLLPSVDHAKLKCHVLIAPGHGIHCTKEFAEATRPEVSIASVFPRYARGLKSTPMLKAVGAKTYVTGLNGTVQVVSDGKTYAVSAEREDGVAIKAAIGRIWLSHATSDPSRLVINWETQSPGNSVVEYGKDAMYGLRVAIDESVTRHHVDIPLAEKDVTYHYRVRTGDEVSADAAFQAYPRKELRVAVVGDWGYAKADDLSPLTKDRPHLLLTAGDNVPSLHEKNAGGTQAFSALIDRQRDLFRSTPFLPILGNHDRELTPRGAKPPEHPVYDPEAKAFREFFALPGDEWKWHFDVPDFGVRFIALDLNHIQDFGTTWQTCHAFDEGSEQFRWYADLMDKSDQAFVFTLNNEKQTQVFGRTKGLWHGQFAKGSALITGFGYFAERAELKEGIPYFNTCLKGDGAAYKDPQSKFFAREDNYLLLTFKAGEAQMKAELKNLRGEVLDARVIQRRPGS
jgi:beta-lactamase superfamily II metal-dependent hydrolase